MSESKKRAREDDCQLPSAKRLKSENYAQTLQQRGAVCIPMAWATGAVIKDLMTQFDATVAAFPEFNPDLPRAYSYQVKDKLSEPLLQWLDRYTRLENTPENQEQLADGKALAAEIERLRHMGTLSPTTLKTAVTQWIGGGFGALGNPSSQHNMFVRRIRQWVMASLAPLFTDLIRDLPQDGGDWKLEKTFDRMLIRSVEQVPTAESLHRDECPNAAPSDVLFGGWFNLTNTDQSFTFVPESHRTSADGKAVGKSSGFSKIVKGSEEYKTLTEKLETIEVRPGEVLIFYEHVAHIVAPTPTKQKMRRTFLGWRLTQAVTPLVSNVQGLITKQAVVPLKSAQVPVMYPQMWRATEMPRLQQWSQTMFDPRLLETVTVASGKSEGAKFKVVPQKLKSLSYYQKKFPDKRWIQPEYSAEERAMYVPGTSWKLLVPGSATEFAAVKL